MWLALFEMFSFHSMLPNLTRWAFYLCDDDFNKEINATLRQQQPKNKLEIIGTSLSGSIEKIKKINCLQAVMECCD